MGNHRLLLSYLIVLLGNVVYGFAIGFSGTFIYELGREQVLSAADTSIIASIYNIGPIISNIPIGFLGNKYGRKPILTLAASLACAGWLTISMSAGIVWIIGIGRLLQGTSSCTALMQVFASELPAKEMRGLFGSMPNLGLFTGITGILVLGALLHWQVVCFVCAGLSLLYIVLLAAFVPESPFWLSTQGRFEESERILLKLRNDKEQVQLELTDLRSTQALSANAEQGSLLQQVKELREPGTWKALLVLLAILFLAYGSGGATIIFYIVTIFKDLGYGKNPYLPSVIVSLTQNVSSLASGFFMIIAKRKTLLPLSAFGMALSMVAVGIVNHFKEHIDEWTKHEIFTDVLTIVLITLFSVLFSLGVASTSNVLIGELCPLKIRGLTSGPASISISLAIFLSNLAFGFLVEAIGIAWTFQAFAAELFILALFSLLCLKETKGKTQEELATLYS